LRKTIEKESSMQSDTMRVLADEELDYIAGGLSGIPSVWFTDTSASVGGDGIDVDLGGGYASVGSESFYTHSDAGLEL